MSYLDEVRSIVDDDLGVEQLRGMLRLRRSQLAAEAAAAADRLSHVEQREIIAASFGLR